MDELPGLISLDLGDGTPLAIAPDAFLKGRAEWTDGAYCVTGSVLAPGQIVPPHAHDVEAQVTVVLSGRIGTWVDGEAEVLGPGGYAFRAPGRPHSIFNPFEQPARFLELTSPGARFQEYMLALSELHSAGTATPEAIGALAAGAGIEAVDVDLRPLLERFRAEGGDA